MVLENLKKFSFTEEEIIVLEDPSYNDVNILVREVALRAAKAQANEQRILTFWYYAGHGMQDNTV